MSDFKIMIDSCADLPADYIQQNDLLLGYLRFFFADSAVAPSFDTLTHSADFKRFYNMLREGSRAMTSQMASDQVKEIMQPTLDGGTDILYIAFSSGLSGTYSSAVQAQKELAEEYPDRKIRIVDSRAASLGLGLMIDYAVELKKAGKNIDEVTEWVENNKFTFSHWFTVDDLHFLQRGGRITMTSAFLGSLLSIKPVLNMDNAGHLILRDKTRGHKRAIMHLLDRLEEMGDDPAHQRIFISHGDDLEGAELLAEKIHERTGNTNIMINYIGAVIGAHSGPGTIALFFKGKDREDFKK